VATRDASVTTRHYLYAYAALIVRASASLGLSLLPVHTGLGVALAIGAVKAFIVLAWFMHLVEENFGAKVFMFLAALLVCTLVLLTALDPLTRAPFPPPPADNAVFQRAAH
jgi:heme/copper-type cytochrome/quinol oxidase subunit 4